MGVGEISWEVYIGEISLWDLIRSVCRNWGDEFDVNQCLGI